MKRFVPILLVITMLFSLSACVTGEDDPTDQTEKADMAKNILADMTLEQKAAQMIMVSCHMPGAAEKASAYGVGALCLYGFEFEGKSADEVISMNSAFQKSSYLPLIISTDEEGGWVNRVGNNPQLRSEPFKSPSEVYAGGGWPGVVADTKEKCGLLSKLGINVNLAPVCDVPLSEEDYIFDRCFSRSYGETARYTALVVETMKKENMGSVLKHFPGYGGSSDTHMGLAYDSRPFSDFNTGDLEPFRAGIKAGAGAVMVSHNIVECMDAEYPASLSEKVHDILRDDLGFAGVIITDDLCMGAITSFTGFEDSVVQAVLAGNDMLCCLDYDYAVSKIVQAVQKGMITEDRIDQSVLRILKWKIDLGIIK